MARTARATFSAQSSTKLCSICLGTNKSFIQHRPCCQLPLCQSCLTRYLDTKVREGVVHVQCPGDRCNTYFKQYEISSALTHNMRQKFHKYLVDSLNDPTLKTCPRCGQERRVPEADLNRREVRRRGYPVTCEACALKWCFACHAPWHEVSCRDNALGDRQLKTWAEEGHGAHINAQKCPGCKIYIQRSRGCNSMNCTRCGANFCYRCGHNFTKIPNLTVLRFFFGLHGDKLSPFGCPDLLLPRAPFRRKLVKGAVFGGKVLACILLPPVVLLLAVVAILALGVMALRLYPVVCNDYKKCPTILGKIKVFLDAVTKRKVSLVCIALFSLFVVVYGIYCMVVWFVS